MFEEAGIDVDTTVAEVADEPAPVPQQAAPSEPPEPEDAGEAEDDDAEASARVVPLRSANG